MLVSSYILIHQQKTTMASEITRKYPRCIATISAGFEKGDFLVREEKGQRVYFDFFEEAFNYIAAKGYSRMPKGEEGEWMELMVSLCCFIENDVCACIQTTCTKQKLQYAFTHIIILLCCLRTTQRQHHLMQSIR